MIFAESWADVIQLAVGIVILGTVGVWDLIVDIKDRDQDKLIKKIETKLMTDELERRGYVISKRTSI